MQRPHDPSERGSAHGRAAEFFELYGLTFRRPQDAMDALLRSPEPLRHGARGIGIAAATYLLVYFFLAHNGGRPTAFAPWLAIPAESYYRYNLILHLPSVLLAWVASAGFGQLLARGLGGRGSFEETLSTLGLATGVAIWTTGLHDLVTTFLGYIGWLDQRSYEDAMSTPGSFPHLLIWTLMTLYVGVFGWLYTCSMRAAHGLGTWRALAAASLAFAVYQGVYLVFNR